MSVLVTADLHFTDNPRDSHRWGLLPWLGDQAAKQKAEAVLLLGDITDAKNNHSEALTNRLVEELSKLACRCPVYIIPGNHDGVDMAHPYFRFLQHLHKDLHFMLKPTAVGFKGLGEVLFLPHTKDHERDWDIELAHHLPSGMVNYIFTHQTYDGCLTENGTRLEGIPPSYFAKFKGQVWSGDIHKPQKVSKNISYVGAPYRCRFGDDYTPRVVLLNNDGTHKDLRFECRDKHLIKLYNNSLASCLRDFEKMGLSNVYAGDQIKVRVELRRADMPMWPAIKQEVIETAAKMELELTGPEAIVLPDEPKAAAKAQERGQQAQTGPQGQLAAYATQKAASRALCAAGEAMLKQAMGAK